jgi:hypothetical protein
VRPERGEKLGSRVVTPEAQALRLGVAVLNGFTALGIPVTEEAG